MILAITLTVIAAPTAASADEGVSGWLKSDPTDVFPGDSITVAGTVPKAESSGTILLDGKHPIGTVDTDTGGSIVKADGTIPTSCPPACPGEHFLSVDLDPTLYTTIRVHVAWSQQGFDASGSSNNRWEGVHSATLGLVDQWQRDFQPQFDVNLVSDIVVGMQYAYVGMRDGIHQAVAAVDRRTGEITWVKQLDLGGLEPPTLALSGHVLLVQTRDAPLQALDARTGDRLWTAAGCPVEFGAYGLTFRPHPVRVQDGIAVDARERTICAVDVETGTVLWSKRGATGGGAEGEIVRYGEAVVNAGRVYVSYAQAGRSTLDHRLMALDMVTGQPIWDQPGDDLTSTAFSDGTVFLYSTLQPDTSLQPCSQECPTRNSPTIAAFDAETGEGRWRATYGTTQQHLCRSIGQYDSCEPFIGKFRGLAVSEDTLVASVGDSGVAAIDARTGAPRWLTTTRALTRPTIAGGGVYVLTSEQNQLRLQALKEPDGGALTNTVVATAVNVGGRQPALSDGTLYLMTGTVMRAVALTGT